MNVNVWPGERCGCVRIPASKSQAHRLLICAALGGGETHIRCDGLSKDIEASVACLNALGAEIRPEGGSVLRVRPIQEPPLGVCDLPCGESGSTLRFLLPLVGALGARAVFYRMGRLPERPLAPFDKELVRHGMRLVERGELLCCSGTLESGSYTLPGNVSSQYISGLLMALPHLPGESSLRVTGPIESAPYITMTEDALRLAGIDFDKRENRYRIPGGQRGALPASLQVEGDWSNAAFFLCMGALSEKGINVMGLSRSSSQGDRAVLEILKRFGAEVRKDGDDILIRRGALRALEIDAAPIPDLVPVLCVAASVAEGESRIYNAARLRLKESDRLRSTTQLLRSLGAEVTEKEDGLVIRGVPSLTGATVDACGDHRIAMAAAAAACVCTSAVTVTGAECVEKSYPRFWADLEQLTGGRA